MKYIKLFEAWDTESEWDRERREKKEAKQAELMKYTINGLKVIDIESFESRGSGFILENKDVILVEWLGDVKDHYDRISYYKYDGDEGYDEETYQDAGSEYDYTYAYKRYKEGNFKPVFNTKADAQTFLHLFKQEYSTYEGYKQVTIKLKYIFTPDKKDSVRVDVKESDFQKFIGRKFVLRKYRYTGKDVNYEIKEVHFDNKFENSIHLYFDLENDLNEHPLIATRMTIRFYVVYSEMGDMSKFQTDLTEYQGFSEGTEWRISDYPEVVAFAKEIRKIFTGGNSKSVKPTMKKLY